MKGGPLHLDESAVAYENLLATDRANTWRANGARAGVFSGADVTPNATELGVDITEFDALVQAVISGTPRAQGWYVWNDVVETVLFAAPSADPRVDALVCAVRAPDLGTIPGGTTAGPQWVTVAGVSDPTAPLAPDAAAIDAAVGPGGWFRWADVGIDPGDTVIDPENVTMDIDGTALLAYARVTHTAQFTSNDTVEPFAANTIETYNRTAFAPGDGVLTIPEPGYYVVSCQMAWDDTVNTGQRHLQLRVAGAPVRSDMLTAFAGSGRTDINSIVYGAWFNGGEVIDAEVYQNSGAAVSGNGAVLDFLEVRQVQRS